MNRQTHRFTFGLLHGVGIVDDDEMRMLARAVAADQGRQPPAARVVDVVGLEVLVALEAALPVALIPRRLQQRAAADTVARGQLLVIGGEKPARVRPGGPDPRREEHTANETLAAPRRNVDEQLLDTPIGHRLKMPAKRLKMPVVYIGRSPRPAARHPSQSGKGCPQARTGAGSGPVPGCSGPAARAATMVS